MHICECSSVAFYYCDEAAQANTWLSIEYFEVLVLVEEKEWGEAYRGTNDAGGYETKSDE